MQNKYEKTEENHTRDNNLDVRLFYLNYVKTRKHRWCL